MCKPHKMGGACRWDAKDNTLLKEWEHDRLAITKQGQTLLGI